MAGVHFGVTVPSEALNGSRRHLYVEDVNRLLNYVKGYYGSAWVVDHLQFGDMDVLEGWTVLSYMAALHPELKWVHTVVCQSFPNPALVAKMGATLQLISGGRFILGIGAGRGTPDNQGDVDGGAGYLRGQILRGKRSLVRAEARPGAPYHGGGVRAEDTTPDGQTCRLVERVVNGSRGVSQIRAGVGARLGGGGAQSWHSATHVVWRVRVRPRSGRSTSL